MGEKIINKFFVLYFGLPVVVLPLLLPLRLCPRPAHLPPPPPRPLFVLFTSCLYFVAGFVIYSKSVPFWLYIENKYIHISTRACIRIYKYTNIHMYVCTYKWDMTRVWIKVIPWVLPNYAPQLWDTFWLQILLVSYNFVICIGCLVRNMQLRLAKITLIITSSFVLPIL